MAELEVVDQFTVQALVAKARDCITAGDDKHAARLLTDAVYSTHDPEIESQVRELAEQGLARAGRFGKGRWAEIIRIVDLRAQRASRLSRRDSPLSDLVITRQFVEQVRPEALRAELLRHIDEGVRAIHISLTLPLRKPVRCIARGDTPELGSELSAASMPPR